MPRSHDSIPKPSLLVALVALTLVQRLRPAWVAVSVCDAARAEGESAERLSRLSSRAATGFDAVLARLTRSGRPPKDDVAERAATELALSTELLGVATALLARLRLRRDAVRPLVVGAYLRLRAALPELTQSRFCKTLALPERTLRAWLAEPAAAGAPELPLEAPAPAPRAPRPPRRRRFSFDVMLPDTQLAADTTDLCAFGVPLKLIATQDVGGRDQDLCASVVVDDHESAELVVQAFTAALTGRPGMQAVTDQGTPYMAELTRAALDALGAEHAPQREGEPTDKATIERAFASIKSFARPLLEVSDRIARAVPALASAALAKAATMLLLTALLRAYQAGARAARRAGDQRAGMSTEALARAAEQSRREAHAHDTSVRLLLEHIHAAYELDVPRGAFVRTHRRFPLEVLREAERAFAAQAHRGDIKKRASYFAAVIRACNDAYFRRHAQKTASSERDLAAQADQRETEQRRRRWMDEPSEWLRVALETIAAFWDVGRRQLVCGGVGAGTAWLRAAHARLVELHGDVAAADIEAGVLRNFTGEWRERLGDDGVDAVANVARQHTPAFPTPSATDEIARSFAAATLRPTGPPQRPAPP